MARTAPTASTPTVPRRSSRDNSGNGANYWVDVLFESTGTPDTEAPVVSVTAPAEGATVSGATVALSADATDNVGVVGVQFRVNGANVGVEDTVAPYTVNWDSTAVANGAYQITAVARDAAGNSTTSPAVNVTVNNVPDTTPPAVVSVAPVNGATNVSPSTVLAVLFDEAMDPASIDGTTVELRDGADNLVAATVGYDAGTQTATLTPGAALAETTTYSALVRGGATDPRVKDVAGNALAADFVWSFTTGAPSAYNSIWSDATVPAVASQPDSLAIEVGVKFQADVSGNVARNPFLQGCGQHRHPCRHLVGQCGRVVGPCDLRKRDGEWLADGALCESGDDRSQHDLCGVVPHDRRILLGGCEYFVNAFVNPPLRALASGEDGPNGVYTYSATPIFPDNTGFGANYWVDILFDPWRTGHPTTSGECDCACGRRDGVECSRLECGCDRQCGCRGCAVPGQRCGRGIGRC